MEKIPDHNHIIIGDLNLNLLDENDRILNDYKNLLGEYNFVI